MSATYIRRPKESRLPLRLAVVLLLVAGAGLAICYVWGHPSVRAERLLSRARALRLAG